MARSTTHDSRTSVPDAKTLARNPVVYLAHKFEKQDEGKLIQARLSDWGIKVLNPFDRKEQEEHDRIIAEKAGQFDDATSAKIVYADLVLIDNADAIVALLFPNAIGTVMEIFYAGHVRRIPVFTHVAYEMPYRHPWIAHYSTVSSPDLSVVMNAVNDWRESR